MLVAFLFLMSSQQLSAFAIYCPNDYWLDCYDDLTDLSVYGNAYYHDYTGYHDAGAPTVHYYLSNCNTGYIVRTWTAYDYSGYPHTCSQTLYVNGSGSFNGYNIHWPKPHYELYGCNPNTDPHSFPPEYGPPTWDYVACSQIGVNKKDKVFYFGSGCKKIIRKWTIVDWCQYNPNYPYSKGIWTFSQTIKIYNTEEPILSCAEEHVFESLNCQETYVDIPPIMVEGYPCYGDYVITNDSKYADHNGPNASGIYPIGKTRVKYKVLYGCGYEKSCYQDIIVKDSKGPVPYCYHTLSVGLMPVDNNGDGIPDDGMVEVWAKDFDVASYHPCGDIPLRFSFSSDINHMSEVFTCANVGKNEVKMWVTDPGGNQSFCIVILDVQNNAANIPDCQPESPYMISGRVANAKSLPVTGVDVSVINNYPIIEEVEIYDTIVDYVVVDSFINYAGYLIYVYEIDTLEVVVDVVTIERENKHYMTTSYTGEFGVEEIPHRRDYSVRARKHSDVIRISQEDVDILKAYLDRRIVFDEPCHYLAADVDGNRQINKKDVDILQEVVDAGNDTEWAYGDQWIFMDRNYYNTLDMNPLGNRWDNEIEIEDLRDKHNDLVFIGILKGDLNFFFSLDKATELPLVTSRSDRWDDTSPRVVPNPVDDQFEIIFQNARDGVVSLKVYDLQGRVVLDNAGVFGRGRHTLHVDSGSLPPGTYYFTLNCETEQHAGKLFKY